jgi:subtilase family serine protease
MLLLLSRSAEQQQGLTEMLSDLQNPASPRYHHWLTPAQFGDAFGVNADDLQSVTSWLQSQGFTVTKVAKARNLIEFSGNVAQLQQAFNTQIHRLSIDGTQTMTSVTPVQVPRALAGVIKGLVNLDSAKPHASVTQAARATYDSTAHRIKPDLTLFDSTGANPILYMDPADAATVYDTPNATLNANYSGTTLDGTGVNVGIVGDSNVDLTAVSNYRQAFLNETSGNVNLPTIVVDGSDPGINGDEIESFLDLEVLGGIAPKAKLYYYTSDSSDLSSGLVNAIGRAIEDNLVSILSISYSSCEANQGAAGNALFAELYQQADAQGITITVSSGDSGPANCDSPNAEHTAANGLAVNALGSTPYNVSVGGTDFDALASDFGTYVDTTTSGVSPYFRTALKYIPERPWNDSTRVNTSVSANVPLTINGATNIIAGGSGISSVYAKPDF